MIDQEFPQLHERLSKKAQMVVYFALRIAVPAIIANFSMGLYALLDTLTEAVSTL